MGKHYNRETRDPYDRTRLRGQVRAKTIASNEIATFVRKEPQLPCWCGRRTYRLNADQPEVCSGCNEPTALCQVCKPLSQKEPTLSG